MKENQRASQSKLTVIQSRAKEMQGKRQNCYFRKAPLRAETADLFARIYVHSAEGNPDLEWPEVFALMLDSFLGTKDRTLLGNIPESVIEDAKARIFSSEKLGSKGGRIAQSDE